MLSSLLAHGQRVTSCPPVALKPCPLLRCFHQIRPCIRTSDSPPTHAAGGPTQSLINALRTSDVDRLAPAFAADGRLVSEPNATSASSCGARNCTRICRRLQAQETRAALLTGLAHERMHALPVHATRLNCDRAPTRTAVSLPYHTSLLFVHFRRLSLCTPPLAWNDVCASEACAVGLMPAAAHASYHQHTDSSTSQRMDACAHPYRKAPTGSELLLEAYRIRRSETRCNFQRIT